MAKNKPTGKPVRNRDPVALGKGLQGPNHGAMLLGLDLGTQAGYAFTFKHPNGDILAPNAAWMGLLDMSMGDSDAGPIRQVKLWHFLENAKPAMVAFEGRDFAGSSQFEISGMKAAELSASFRTSVALWCHFNNTPCCAVPIGTVKKRATGSGNAGKPAIVQACNLEFGTNFSIDDCEKTHADDVADAAFVLAVLIDHYGDGVDGSKTLRSGMDDHIAIATSKVRVLELPAGGKQPRVKDAPSDN